MSKDHRVDYEVRDRIACIALNCAPADAIDHAMIDAIHAGLRRHGPAHGAGRQHAGSARLRLQVLHGNAEHPVRDVRADNRRNFENRIETLCNVVDTADVREGLAAFLEKRPPRWRLNGQERVASRTDFRR